MKVCKVNLIDPQPEIIKLAAEVLKSGGLVIYPTDTAYGLGANALSEQAIKKMYEAKGRDFSKPTHVVVQDWIMLKAIAEENPEAKILFESFVPGPLTIILKKKPIIPAFLTANLSTIGVRIPNLKLTKALSKEVNFPYTTSSANLSGGRTPYTANEAIEQIGQYVDLVLDAGELPRVSPSTIVDTTYTPLRILREGSITKEEIERVLGDTLRLQV
ncbi:MAG: L-threonylcarbamoyladenylate synthase [bacterium]|nr:L-threonylcarbamoyladenylate synthase [bacterium]